MVNPEREDLFEDRAVPLQVPENADPPSPESQGLQILSIPSNSLSEMPTQILQWVERTRRVTLLRSATEKGHEIGFEVVGVPMITPRNLSMHDLVVLFRQRLLEFGGI